MEKKKPDGLKHNTNVSMKWCVSVVLAQSLVKNRPEFEDLFSEDDEQHERKHRVD